jgi:hypothetical protein
MRFRFTKPTNHRTLAHWIIVKFCSSLRTSEQSFLIYRVYSASIDNILCLYVKCTIRYKGKVLLLTICACYLWKMVLNIGLDASFVKKQNCKEIQRKERDVNHMEVFIIQSYYKWFIRFQIYSVLKTNESFIVTLYMMRYSVQFSTGVTQFYSFIYQWFYSPLFGPDSFIQICIPIHSL